MIWIFGILLIIIANVEAQNKTEIASQLLPYEKFGRAWCLKQINPMEYAIVMASLGNIKTCFSDGHTTAREICHLYEVKYEPCIQKYLYPMKKCLAADEQYFPDFLLNGQKRTIKQMCTKRNVAKLLDDLSIGTCSRDIREILQEEVNLKCVSTLRVKRHLDQNGIILSKKAVCRDTRTYPDCLFRSVDKYCIISNEGRRELHSMFDEELRDC